METDSEISQMKSVSSSKKLVEASSSISQTSSTKVIKQASLSSNRSSIEKSLAITLDGSSSGTMGDVGEVMMPSLTGATNDLSNKLAIMKVNEDAAVTADGVANAASLLTTAKSTSMDVVAGSTGNTSVSYSATAISTSKKALVSSSSSSSTLVSSATTSLISSKKSIEQLQATSIEFSQLDEEDGDLKKKQN